MLRSLPRRALAIVLCLASLSVLTGTSWAKAHGEPATTQQDPWPQEEYWPSDLEGPFEVEKTPIEVEAEDGVKLRGTLWMPVGLPESLKIPAILWNSPYFGNTDATSDDPNESGVAPLQANDGTIPHSGVVRVPKMLLARSGYAVAAVSVRGTGQSGGCMDLNGPIEGRDATALIDWLARQPWSSGRVGQIGMSYDGYVTIRGAIEGHPALKTIVAMNAPIDYYTTVNATPEGAQQPFYTAIQGASNLALYDTPTIHRDPQSGGEALTRFLDVTNEDEEVEASPGSSAIERVCPEQAELVATNVHDTVATDKTEDFYLQRRLYGDLSRITAASLIAMGLKDGVVLSWGLDSVGWDLIDAPKSMVLGQWGHCTPRDLTDGWDDRVLRWFDFWLKGLGDLGPELGHVDYELNTDPEIGDCINTGIRDGDQWAQTSAWPPKETREEALYLTERSLADHHAAGLPADFSASFSSDPYAALCGDSAEAVAFTSDRLDEEAWLTGNPFTYLEMTSDAPEGIVEARLVELGEGFDCATSPDDRVTISIGAADLRYYRGNFSPITFDTDEPVMVRISFQNIAERVESGHRLALILSGQTINDMDPTYTRAGAIATPNISILAGGRHDSSQLVLPISNGSVGKPATGHYPIRADLPS